MAQGNHKNKKSNVDLKLKKTKKGKAFTKRSNCPAQSKKKNVDEGRKLKNVVTKTVNKTIEEEIRSKVSDNKQTLSNAQKAVAEYHKKTS